ncbi:MAG: GntR family transcriptional regulator [Dehalococcoidia bacterium]
MHGNGRRAIISQVERVYESMRRAILDGRYQPGKPLRLNVIATENEVSFIPVREALRLLEAARLVEIIPNKGARVAEVSESDMVDAYALRIILEALAIEKACTLITDEEMAEASTLLETMVEAFEAGDLELSATTHRAFHLTLYRAARSTWLIHLVELLMSNTDRYRRLLTPARPSDAHLRVIRSQHTGILNAVKARDPALATRLLREHLEDTLTRYKAGLAERV